MPESVVIDEFHLVLHVPKRLREDRIRRIRRTLKRPSFATGLEEALRQWLSRFPSLRRVRITVER